MGKAVDFIHATNDVLTQRGVRLPLDGQATTTPDTHSSQGRAVQERIAGADRVERMYASAAEDELHFQRFLSANCFGDYLTRDGIGVPVRSDQRRHARRPGWMRPAGQEPRGGQP